MATRELPSDDLYAVLGIPENAAGELIDARFRALAKLFHPDRNPDDPEAEDRFKRISAAYRVLSDPTRRSEYDSYRHLLAPDELPRPEAIRPTVKPGSGIKRRAFPRPLRLTIAITLIVSGIAVMVWRLLANDRVDAATDVTLWIVGIKLLVVGLVALLVPQLRAVWDRMSTNAA